MVVKRCSFASYEERRVGAELDVADVGDFSAVKDSSVDDAGTCASNRAKSKWWVPTDPPFWGRAATEPGTVSPVSCG